MMEEVHALLQQFQDGYTLRDQSYLDEFMELFVAGDELEIIGTGALRPGKGEWCIGRDHCLAFPFHGRCYPRRRRVALSPNAILLCHHPISGRPEPVAVEIKKD